MVAHFSGAKPAQFRILLFTPLVGGQLHDDVAHGLIATALQDVEGIVFEWRRYKGAGLTVARNEGVRLMYELKCHAIIFIDSDNPFVPARAPGPRGRETLVGESAGTAEAMGKFRIRCSGEHLIGLDRVSLTGLTG